MVLGSRLRLGSGGGWEWGWGAGGRLRNVVGGGRRADGLMGVPSLQVAWGSCCLSPGPVWLCPPPFPSACALPGPGGPQAQQHPLPSVQSFHWSFHPGVHLLPPPEQSLPTGQDTLPAPDQDTLFNPPTRLPDPSR